MYSVSESYKNALLQKHITDTVEGTAVLKDGTVIELDDSNIVVGSLKIIHELCDDYKVGTFNLGSMHIGFFDDNALGRDFSGAKITLTYKIETENGWESVPLGIFIADGQTVIRRRDTVTLTAYDYGILFDCTLGVTLRNKTGTAEQIISDACDRCGVEFGGIADGLPNTDVYVHCGSEQIQSCRDLVGWCAAMIGGYAVIGRDGALKIISARYDVEADDPSVIIIDKYLTAAERNSIYSTDTRAWIAQMSAYSGDSTKIYKSKITRDDPQAARAIYYLEKNPLMEGLDTSVCDEINCAWLSFMDGFMQRGITAELYGDPALDVGDVLRCSEGDVDQRSSVVGLVTKQEWRYRNYHTVICASAQLSDGFPDSEEEESSDEAEAVGTTDSVYPVKVVSQYEKRGNGSGGKYYAGQGLSLSPDNTFALNFANAATRGGLYIVGGEWVSPDDASADLGIYKNSSQFPALRTATNYQKGGFFLGDGFVPVLEEGTDSAGETTYTATDFVQLRLGDGLEFVDNNEASADTKELRENYYGGRKVGVKIDGSTLKMNDKGELTAEGGSVYKAGGGIVIEEGESEKTIKADIDGETIVLNNEGKLKSNGVTIENGIIIQEADAKYLLHEYTEVEYIAGNRIGYAGAQNQIIVQGLVVYKSGGTAANGVAIPISSTRYTDESLVPDIPLYNDFTFASPTRNNRNNYEVSRCYLNFASAATAYNSFQHIYVKDDGTEVELTSFDNYDGYSYGWFLLWTNIYPPGYTDGNGITYPFGCATCSMLRKYKSSATQYYIDAGNAVTNALNIGFASEAEYNAAVGLTYEPVTLTEVTETTTEV